jgi:5-carboxymethyl-2-hydroxymuconate isomerase
MPHLRLEYSSNIKETIKPKELFTPCHQILVDAIHANPVRCQSRALCCDHFHVGEGSSEHAFIYLEVSILEGRPASQLQEVGIQLLKALEGYFQKSLRELKVQMAVRIAQISISDYFKWN